jgi:hypothetical protein
MAIRHSTGQPCAVIDVDDGTIVGEEGVGRLLQDVGKQHVAQDAIHY